jgi:hypothetical protein
MINKEVYGKALRYLQVRFLSEGELVQKLNRYGAVEGDIVAVINQLKQERFIDDQRLALAVAEQYMKKKQYGRLYIVHKLKRRYLPIPSILSSLNERDIACQLVKQKFLQDDVDKKKIARYLTNRGFSVSIISEILHEYLY